MKKMPTKESVSFNSSRVQRATRINSIEQGRLSHQLNLLDRQRVHSMRLNNQDIRLVSVTLDYIQTSSGHSAEGLPPDYVDTSTQHDLDPCFLYGERVGSRKYSRIRKATSASQRRTHTENNTAENQRPSTSPEGTVSKLKLKINDSVLAKSVNVMSVGAKPSSPRQKNPNRESTAWVRNDSQFMNRPGKGTDTAIIMTGQSCLTLTSPREGQSHKAKHVKNIHDASLSKTSAINVRPFTASGGKRAVKDKVTMHQRPKTSSVVSGSRSGGYHCPADESVSAKPSRKKLTIVLPSDRRSSRSSDSDDTGIRRDKADVQSLRSSDSDSCSDPTPDQITQNPNPPPPISRTVKLLTEPEEKSEENNQNQKDNDSEIHKNRSAFSTKKKVLHSRDHRLASVVNQMRVLTSSAKRGKMAAKKKSSWHPRVGGEERKKKIMEYKVHINKERQRNLFDKLDNFMTRYPLKRYEVDEGGTESTF